MFWWHEEHPANKQSVCRTSAVPLRGSCCWTPLWAPGEAQLSTLGWTRISGTHKEQTPGEACSRTRYEQQNQVTSLCINTTCFSFFKWKQMLIQCLTPTYMHKLTTLIPTKSQTFSTHQNQLGSYKAHATSHCTQLKNSVSSCCFPSLIVLKTHWKSSCSVDNFL